jgi:hypothetical protein
VQTIQLLVTKGNDGSMTQSLQNQLSDKTQQGKEEVVDDDSTESVQLLSAPLALCDFNDTKHKGKLQWAFPLAALNVCVSFIFAAKPSLCFA